MRNLCRLLIASLSFSAFSVATCAETEEQKLTTLILEQDRLFWNAYNTCDLESFKKFFTDDVEFYHDQGGVTLGVNALTETVRTNLCGSNPRRVRREAVPGSVKVFPLRNGMEIYGAIISGEHLFYVTEPGKKEKLQGRANFTHLWLIKNGAAKMARVLSFNHHPATEENRKE
ncbi:MAG TPA: nuclear transport factor 2 family protein [Candidatus Limnocylindrales bacterium]|jgi:hypothetical protein|nr:nuclear transport factor 2 family protein [Candidatus Limnocylindrales bacterium]